MGKKDRKSGRRAADTSAEIARNERMIEQVTGHAEPPRGSAPEQRPLDGVERDQRDTQVPGIVIVGLALVASIAGSMLIVHLFIAGLSGSPMGKYTEPAQFGDFNKATDDPRFRNLPQQQARELHSLEASLLTTYAWVEKNAGTARIPIERAIEIVAERGLPAAEPATATAATTATTP